MAGGRDGRYRVKANLLVGAIWQGIWRPPGGDFGMGGGVRPRRVGGSCRLLQERGGGRIDPAPA